MPAINGINTLNWPIHDNVTYGSGNFNDVWGPPDPDIDAIIVP